MATSEIEDRIMSERRPQAWPPTPGNPMFVINVGGGFALGTVFTSAEKAKSAADRLKLANYSIEEEQAA